ncbi:MAG: DUF6922 domain-containing protein [Ginsengibacter sp.]
MIKKTAITSLYSPLLFWDIDTSKLDPEKNSRLIIERVFSLGTLNEIKKVIEEYGKEKVVDTLTCLNYLDPKTLNFVSLLFNKTKNEFRCYVRRQSGPQLWNS